MPKQTQSIEVLQAAFAKAEAAWQEACAASLRDPGDAKKQASKHEAYKAMRAASQALNERINADRYDEAHAKHHASLKAKRQAEQKPAPAKAPATETKPQPKPKTESND